MSARIPEHRRSHEDHIRPGDCAHTPVTGGPSNDAVAAAEAGVELLVYLSFLGVTFNYRLSSSPAAIVWGLFQFHQSKPQEALSHPRSTKGPTLLAIAMHRHTLMKQRKDGRTGRSEQSADERRGEVM